MTTNKEIEKERYVYLTNLNKKKHGGGIRNDGGVYHVYMYGS